MAIFADFNVKQSDNAKELLFTETTGIYNGVSNTGGYGAPNELTTDATAASLEIVTPEGTTYTLNLFGGAFNYPKNDTNNEYIIRSQNIGLGNDVELSDGIYNFKYTVTLPTQGDVVNDQCILISGKARCCVYSMLANININDCDGSDRRRALEAFTYYRAAIACAASGEASKFTELLQLVSKYCNSTC
tara:strand:+ start:21380 stop:21946 length:567 start_codon:yes stop_codon:yes gene_type:complete